MISFIFGALLIGLGLSIFIKEFFGVEVPIVRFFIAAALIYLGATMIFNVPPRWFCHRYVAVSTHGT